MYGLVFVLVVIVVRDLCHSDLNRPKANDYAEPAWFR